MTGRRWRRGALALLTTGWLGLAGEGAGDTLYVEGETLVAPGVESVLVLPDGSLLDAAELIARYHLAGYEADETLVYQLDVEQGLSGPTPLSASAGGPDPAPRLQWLAYDAEQRLFVPSAAGARIESHTPGSGRALEPAGAIVLRATAVPEPAPGFPVAVAVATLWLLRRSSVRIPRA